MICASSDDSDQPGHPPSLIRFRCALFMRMPRLIRVFAGRTGHFIGFVMLWLKFISKKSYVVKYELAHVKTVLIPKVNSDSSDEPAHLRSLATALAVHSHNRELEP